MAEFIRTFYTISWWLALPLVLGRLWWRGRREPGYRQHIKERLGWYRQRDVDAAQAFFKKPLSTIWIHAVSVGETRAAEPLINALLASDTNRRIVLTHMTPTGRATGAALYAHHGSRLTQCYLPYDIGSMVARFIRHFQVQACLLIETEVWPNLVARCKQEDVPVALVNARLSARSFRQGQRMGRLISTAAQTLTCVGAQTEADAARLRLLGANPVTVTGSIKFDVEPSAVLVALGARWRGQFGQRKVVLFASTREGEEAAILAALRGQRLDALLVIVPRHPQRFDEVAALIAQEGLSLARRSQLGEDAVPSAVEVLLGDSMGEMTAYYAAADVAFIGGSLLPLGGQNLIEACAVGTPVLVGPHTFNFKVVTEDAIYDGAARRVEDASSLLAAIAALLEDTAQCSRMANTAQAFAVQHRGATARTMTLLNTTVVAVDSSLRI